jgi:hypothetical protein
MKGGGAMKPGLNLKRFAIIGSLCVVACGGANGDDLLGDAAPDGASRGDAGTDATSQDTSSDTSVLDHSVPDTAVDAPPDVHHPKDATGHDVTPKDTGPTTFACGTKKCTAEIEFCYLEGGGIEGPDGGIGLKGSCHPVPKPCEPTPTCTCIQPYTMGSCPSTAEVCMDSGGDVTITCEVP